MTFKTLTDSPVIQEIGILRWPRGAVGSSPRVQGSNRSMRTPGARRRPDAEKETPAKLVDAQNGVTLPVGEKPASSKRHAHIRRATAAVNWAIAAGRLPHPKELTCVDCGCEATEYDHRDYSRPLDVVSVCHSCNIRRGPGIRPSADYVPRANRKTCKYGHELTGERSRATGGRYCKTCVALSKRRQRAEKPNRSERRPFIQRAAVDDGLIRKTS